VGYEWGKGLATTQTGLVNPQLNSKRLGHQTQREEIGVLRLSSG